MRPGILRNSQPIHGAGSNCSIRIFVQELLQQRFRLRPFLFHDRDARQTHEELRGEVIFGKITFNPIPFLAGFVQDDHGGRPHSFKAPETGGILLDVNSDGNEVLLNE